MTESTLRVIEVALGKRKLLERSEEDGVWGRSGPGAESLYGCFANEYYGLLFVSSAGLSFNARAVAARGSDY